ncbi:MAG: hypothetical protein ACYDGR_00955 [Candidatus Dormibacteria bacterium]
MQYAAYHFAIDEVRAIVPVGQEILMLGRALAKKLPSVARHDVMHGSAQTEMVEGNCYVIAFDVPKVTRESIDQALHKIKGYRGMKIIELGRTPGYDLVKGRIPKP